MKGIAIHCIEALTTNGHKKLDVTLTISNKELVAMCREHGMSIEVGATAIWMKPEKDDVTFPFFITEKVEKVAVVDGKEQKTTRSYVQLEGKGWGKFTPASMRWLQFAILGELDTVKALWQAGMLDLA